MTKGRAWLMREYPDPELNEHFGRGEDVECVHFLCIFLLPSLALFYSKGDQLPICVGEVCVNKGSFDPLL